MALELKSGPMLWHKRRFFGSNWRDVHSVLYNDSSLLWYKDRSLKDQEGGVVLKDAPELIAFGPYTSSVPDRPSLPDSYEQKQLLAFGTRGKDVVYWFLCPNEQEVESWMIAIRSLFPPPPAPPPPPTASVDGEKPPQQVPPGEYNPPQAPPQYSSPPPPRQQPPPYQPPASSIPGQYPARMGFRPPPYQGYNTVHPQPYAAPAGGNTTVVVQQDRPGGYVGGIGGGIGGGGGDFAMGMLLGGAIGTAWGSATSHSHGFGYGGGWGGGFGGGWGGGGHTSRPAVERNDVTINNYYDNDTSVVNNNMDVTNNLSIEQEAPVVSQPLMEEEVDPIAVEDVGDLYDGGDLGGEDFGEGDYGGDDFGGGDFGGDDFGGGDFGDF